MKGKVSPKHILAMDDEWAIRLLHKVNPVERVARLSLEDRLAGISLEEVLAYYKPEEVLTSLPIEEIETWSTKQRAEQAKRERDEPQPNVARNN